jgi:hypothetical protein
MSAPWAPRQLTPQGKGFWVGRAVRLACFLEEAAGPEGLATVIEVGTSDYNDGDSENVLWFHYTDSPPGEEDHHYATADGGPGLIHAERPRARAGLLGIQGGGVLAPVLFFNPRVGFFFSCRRRGARPLIARVFLP